MFGPYRLDGLLGKGGMGEVHRAYDTEHDRVVALKVLPAALSADPQYRARFRREAKLASQLTDPHIVPIHRYGEFDGQLYLDMRLVDGEDLADVLSRDGKLDAEAAVRAIEQVASALDSAHVAGLIHRDVKPSNVFLTRPARPGGARFAYLGDFGIARAVEQETGAQQLTATGTALGTLAYMSPERFLGEGVDSRSDVYALACVLYEALTGSRPFPGSELPALMTAHLHAPPPMPTHHPVVGRQLPRGFDVVVARGMAKDPDQRYATAGDLAAAARSALSGRVAVTPGPGGAARSWDPTSAEPGVGATFPMGKRPPRQQSHPSFPSHPGSGMPPLPPPVSRAVTPPPVPGPAAAPAYRPPGYGPVAQGAYRATPGPARGAWRRPPGTGAVVGLLVFGLAVLVGVLASGAENAMPLSVFVGTVFGSMALWNIRPSRMGTGVAAAAMVLVVPIAFMGVLVLSVIAALVFGMEDYGSFGVAAALLFAVLGVVWYGLWATSLWWRRERRPAY